MRHCGHPVWRVLSVREAIRARRKGRLTPPSPLHLNLRTFTHGGQGESLVHPYTRGSVSLSQTRGPGREYGAS